MAASTHRIACVGESDRRSEGSKSERRTTSTCYGLNGELSEAIGVEGVHDRWRSTRSHKPLSEIE